MYGVSFDDIEQGLLPDPILLLEELVFRVGPGNVPPDDLYSEPKCVHQLILLIFTTELRPIFPFKTAPYRKK